MPAPGSLRLLLAAAALSGSLAQSAPAEHPAAPAVKVLHKTVKVGDLDIFYREAGPKDAPAILLLHGFPTSSQMFRNLIPLLADKYRVVAPDYPGYGHSSMPPHDKFAYTFDNLAKVIDEFTEKVGLKKYALYVQDYGAPVGYRLASRPPGADHRHRGAERQRLRRGPRQRLLEADQGVLEGAEEQGEARRHPQPAHLRGDQVAVHDGRQEPRAGQPGRGGPRPVPARPQGQRRDPARPVPQLRQSTRRCTRSGRSTSASTSRRC